MRDDGRLGLQAVPTGAPARPVDVGPLAEPLVAAIAHVEPYEGRGWDEQKVLDRVPDLARVAGPSGDTSH